MRVTVVVHRLVLVDRLTPWHIQQKSHAINMVYEVPAVRSGPGYLATCLYKSNRLEICFAVHFSSANRAVGGDDRSWEQRDGHEGRSCGRISEVVPSECWKYCCDSKWEAKREW